MTLPAARLIRILGLFLIALAPIGPVESAEIRFRAECAPAANLVRLGDVADVIAAEPQLAADLQTLELFPAPPLGDRTIVSVREICDRLALRGVNLAAHSLSGASRVTITTAASPVVPTSRPTPAPSEAIRQQAIARVKSAIIEYLSQFTDATPAWQVALELTDSQVCFISRASARPTVRGGQEPWTGNQRFQLSLATGDSAGQMTIDATITPARPIVVANRALGRGVVINRADLRLESPTTEQAAQGALVSLEDVVGRETVRAISAGEPIRQDAVQAPLVVRKRDIVTVYVRSPGIRVRVIGRAVEDGALGSVITVESLTDRKTFFARVSGPQEVEVYARAQQANTDRPDTEPSLAAKE
jgi:flagella basal body P-ring formation protein FlgA